MAPYWRASADDVRELIPDCSDIEYVDSGGRKHVFSFAQGGKRWAALLVPVPSRDHIPDESELEDEVIEMQARLARETAVVSRTKHPTMVKPGPLFSKETGFLNGQTQNGTVFWFTEEFVEGKSLKRLIDDKYIPPASEVVALLEEILGCIEEFREASLVHRDIKPQNIMKLNNPSKTLFKLLDAGVALDERASRLTDDRRPMGTKRYMSPEQISGEPLDWRSDLFALALTTFEYATGQHPLVPEGKATVDEIRQFLTEETPRKLTELRSDLPGALVELITSLLRKRPHLRPSGNVLRDRLVSIKEQIS